MNEPFTEDIARMEASSSQIDAILSLLDDPDPIVQHSIRGRLLQLGEQAAPALRALARGDGDELARANADGMLKEIGLMRLRGELRAAMDVAGDGDIDLERGAFAVARLGYPEFSAEACRSQLDTMAALLESRLQGVDNGYLVAREMNFYLFDQLGYQGCRQDRESYYDPENSFLNRVMERRVGIPISLSLVYVLVGQRLRLPLYGVGFPRRFLVTYRSASEEFFIDPFNSGTVLNYSDCRRMLRDMNVDFRPEFLEPITNRKTVGRMLRNLIDIYRTAHPTSAVGLEEIFRELIPEAGNEPPRGGGTEEA